MCLLTGLGVEYVFTVDHPHSPSSLQVLLSFLLLFFKWKMFDVRCRGHAVRNAIKEFNRNSYINLHVSSLLTLATSSALFVKDPAFQSVDIYCTQGTVNFQIVTFNTLLIICCISQRLT